MKQVNEYTYSFQIGNTDVVAKVEEHWVEYTFYFSRGTWARKFVSKAGYTGPHELREVAYNLMQRMYDEYKRRKEAQ